MDPIVKIHKNVLDEIARNLAPGEQVFVAVSYGRADLPAGAAYRPDARDYLIITDIRLLDIKGTFFVSRTGFTSYPRKLIVDAHETSQSSGSTITVQFADPRAPGKIFELVFVNCSKPEAPFIVKELTRRDGTSRCPACRAAANPSATYCPKCGAPLRRICPGCGKPVAQDAVQCPVCGKKIW